MKPISWNWALALGAALALLLAWGLSPSLAGHGLRATYSFGLQETQLVALITPNDTGLPADEAVTVVWEGSLFQPAVGQAIFRVPRGVTAALTLDGAPVFATNPTSPLGPDSVTVPLAAGFYPLRLEVTPPAGRSTYYQAGLEWRTALGWRLVAPVYLYPAAADQAEAARAVQRRGWAIALAALGLGLALALGLRLAWSHRRLLRSRTALSLALIVAAAFGLRLLILSQLTAPANADVLVLGSDQHGYGTTALSLLRGAWEPGAYRVQPGLTFVLAGLYALFGPSMRAVQVVQMLLGALASLLVFDVARRLFDRPSAWVAALLWAVFAQPIFYEAQFLTHGLEAPVGLLLLWLWVGALQSRRWRWWAALGLALGAASVLRPTFLALAPLIAASLVGRQVLRPKEWPAAAGKVLALAVLVLLPIAPVTWHNYQANGQFQLLSGQNDVTLYLGNNRDSTGLGEADSPAYRATHTLVNLGETTFLKQTIDDITAEPGRWLGLMARKTALLLGDPELPNNVDFYAEGTARSPLLASLPLRFGVMMALGLAGTVLALRDPARTKRELWALLAYALVQALLVILYSSFSRFRAPLFPVLAVLGGYVLARVMQAIRRRAWRETATVAATMALAGLLVAAMPWAAENVMRRPILRELPAASIRLDAPIGDALTLVGYDPLPAARPGEPVFITLYWQANAPIAQDLFATVQALAPDGSGLKLAQADQALGTGSFPDYAASQWRPGEIVRDRYLLQIPVEAATPRGLMVLAAAYHRDTGERVGERTFGSLPVTNAAPLELPPEAQLIGAQVGTATLVAYQAVTNPDTLTLTLTLYWAAGGPMAEDGVVFVHLLDTSGAFVLGQDSRPMAGLYGTQAWQSGEGIIDAHVIALPADLPPGEYQIVIGLYDAATQARLPVIDAGGRPAPEGGVNLGTIEVK